MTQQFKGITKTQKLFSMGYCICREDGCRFKTNTDDDESDTLINHYINAHDYRILYIGPETSVDSGGQQHTHTVVFMGR